MQDGSREIMRVNAREKARSRLPPIATAKDTNAPTLPIDANHLEVQAAGTVTVTRVILWDRSPESSRTQRRTCIDEGMASRKIAT